MRVNAKVYKKSKTKIMFKTFLQKKHSYSSGKKHWLSRMPVLKKKNKLFK